MALSNLQKLTVLKYLGLPLTSIDSTKLAFSNIINNRLNDVTGDYQTLVEDTLAKLEGTDQRLAKALTRAGVKAIDDIEFFGENAGRTEFQILRSEKNNLIIELANLLDISVPVGSAMGRVSLG